MNGNSPRTYNRQKSDIYLHNRSERNGYVERQEDHGQMSIPGTIKRVQNGSVTNRCENSHTGVNETSSRYFINRSKSEGTGLPSSVKQNGDVDIKPHHKPRSESVVRFHDDVVTGVHIDYRDKIHVDEIRPEHNGDDVEHTRYNIDTFELQPSLNDRKRRKSTTDKNHQQSHEHNNSSSQHDTQRNESKRSRETKFVVGNERMENKTKSSSIKGDSSDTARKHKQLSVSTSASEGQKQRHSSKRKTSKPIEPNFNKFDSIQHSKQSIHKPTLINIASLGNNNDKHIQRETRSPTRTVNSNLYMDNKSDLSSGKLSKKYTGKIDLITPSDKTSQHSNKKKRKICCLLFSLVSSIVIVGAMVTGAVLFIQKKGKNEDDFDSPRVYDMLNVHVRLRVLNQNYTEMFQNSSSADFKRFSVQMSNEVDVIYITSHMSQNYFGCRVVSLRSGSVRVYYISPFLETSQTSNISLHREILLNNLITLFSPVLPVNTTVLGDFLIDINSIEITFERFQTTTLPQRPTMPVRVLSTSSTSPVIKESIGDVTPNMPTTILDNNVLPTQSTTIYSTTVLASTSNDTQKDIPPGERTDPTTSTREGLGGQDIQREKTTQTMHGGEGQPGGVKKPVNRTFITSRHDNVQLNTEPAKIGFLINSTVAITSLRISHRNFRKELFAVRNVSLQALTDKTDLTYIVSSYCKMLVKFVDNSVFVRLDFTTVTCTDTGIYSCKVTNTEGSEIFGDSILNGKAKPGMPQLSLPIALIENRETKQPIMCTADVGFPNGHIQWKIKPKGLDDFLPFDGHFVSQSGECDNYVTSALIYTPTKDGNGTVLKCEVVNKYVPHQPDLTAVTDLYILPENICDGIKDNKTIRHPSTCTHYIRCNGNNFEVKECAKKMCYDEESARCGQTKLSMTDVIAYINEGVTSLQCRLDHLGTWNNVTISKIHEDGRREPIVSVTSDGSDVMMYNTTMKDRIFVHKESSSDFETKINLWLYVLTCTDEGVYQCEAVTPVDYRKTSGRIELRGKPEAPKLFVPNEVVEGLPLRQNVTCQANVGYPKGNLILKMKAPNETEFRPIKYNVTTEEAVQNCSSVIRKTFTFTPTLRHERSQLLCEVENNVTLPVNKKLVAIETVHVVPRNFCLNHRSSTPRVHPHDCHQYVQCSEGYIYVQRCGSDHCFNPYTLHCDIEVEDAKIPFDPKHPCLPDKNGVFFHHPILCNKYIWCVQGQELVHHCPLGTLYIDGGQCTFEPERSRCYQSRKIDLM